MGIDFVIVDDNGNMIDRYAIKWLCSYDKCFFHIKNIREAIVYCIKEISLLEREIAFIKKKEWLLYAIEQTKNEAELDQLLLHDIKDDFTESSNNDFTKDKIVSSLKHFQSFLEKYGDCKCEITW